jgi:iron complex outermembrane receptor protein
MKIYFALLLSFLCIQQSVLAQNDDVGDKEIYQLFDVSLENLLNVGIVSASKKKQSVLDAPASAYVITKEQIMQRAYDNLVDLLEDIPEIEIQKNSSNFSKNIITVRGVSGNEKLLILLNGIRITPTTGDFYAFGTQFSLVNAERVEVVLGPASALYGVDAFSGIVNIITQSQGDEKNTVVNVATSYGQYETSQSTIYTSIKADKIRLSLAGSWYQSDEPDYHNLYKEDFRWYNQQYNPNGFVLESPFFQQIREVDEYADTTYTREFEMPTKSYFLNGEVTYNDFTVGYIRLAETHSSATGTDPKYAIRTSGALIDMFQEVLYGKYKYTSFNKKWNLQTTFSQTLFQLRPQSNYVNATTQYNVGHVYSLAQSSKFEEQLNYTFSSKVSTIAGFSYENLNATPIAAPSIEDIDTSEPLVEQDIYYIGANPNEDSTHVALKQQFFNLNYYNYGAYLQTQIVPWEFLDITVGLRYDFNTRFGGTFNPRIGFVFKPNTKIRFKLLYGSAFLAPSPQKAYAQSGSFTQGEDGVSADFFHLRNPTLDPERLRSFETSFNYFINPNLAFSINGFYTDIEDIINFFGSVPDGFKQRLTEFEVTELEIARNQGNQNIYGGTVRLNFLKKIGFWSINNYLAYSYIDGELEQETRINGQDSLQVLKPFYTAKHTIKAGVSLTYKKLSISPRLIYRTGSVGELKNENNSNQFYKNPDFLVVNLAARYQIKNHRKYQVDIFTKINNLTNLRYYNVFIGNEEGFPLTPQDPIRIQTGVQWKLK